MSIIYTIFSDTILVLIFKRKLKNVVYICMSCFKILFFSILRLIIEQSWAKKDPTYKESLRNSMSKSNSRKKQKFQTAMLQQSMERLLLTETETWTKVASLQNGHALTIVQMAFRFGFCEKEILSKLSDFLS